MVLFSRRRLLLAAAASACVRQKRGPDPTPTLPQAPPPTGGDLAEQPPLSPEPPPGPNFNACLSVRAPQPLRIDFSAAKELEVGTELKIYGYGETTLRTLAVGVHEQSAVHVLRVTLVDHDGFVLDYRNLDAGLGGKSPLVFTALAAELLENGFSLLLHFENGNLGRVALERLALEHRFESALVRALTPEAGLPAPRYFFSGDEIIFPDLIWDSRTAVTDLLYRRLQVSGGDRVQVEGLDHLLVLRRVGPGRYGRQLVYLA